MLPMHPLLSPPTTTRRKVVRTGARLAYAAPMIATTMELSSPTRATTRPSPGVCPQGVFTCGARDPECYRCAPHCRCYARLGGGTVCARENECDFVAACDNVVPCAAGLVCVTSSCCDTPVCLTPCAA
jgi:hypothetical protein